MHSSQILGWALFSSALLISNPGYAQLSYVPTVTDDGFRILVVRGAFEFEDDLSRFTAAVRGLNPDVVTFDSPGGNVSKAMDLGRLVRAHGLATIQIRSGECSSACALAFVGGASRLAEPGSIGVHKSSFGPDFGLSTQDAVSAIQQLTADVMAYLGEMGVDPALLQLALRYESDDIRYLSRSEMERYRVVTVDTASTPPVPSIGASTPIEAPSSRATVPRSALSIPAARTGRILHPRGQASLKDHPDTSASDIAVLPNSNLVTIIQSRDRWYEVRAEGKSGWMHHTWIHVDQFEGGHFGTRHVQVKSFDNLHELEAYIRASPLPLDAFLATNGWFAVTLQGTYGEEQARQLVRTMKARGAIPEDSFMTFGNTYARKVCCD